jgi:guanylate kinase
MARGKLITVSGPTGSGKGTLMRHALARYPQLLSPLSYTTRPRRANSVENSHYAFISEDEFKRNITEGAFLEWAEFDAHYYGTLKQEIEQGLAAGQVMFKEMEIQGVQQVKRILSKDELVCVFIDAGPWDELRARALAREPMSEDALERRHRHYKTEIAFMPEADIIIQNKEGAYREAEEAFEAVIAKALREASV